MRRRHHLWVGHVLVLGLAARSGHAVEPIDLISHLDTEQILQTLPPEIQQQEADYLANAWVYRVAYVTFDPSPLYEQAALNPKQGVWVDFDLFPDVQVQLELRLSVKLEGRLYEWAYFEVRGTSATVICPGPKVDKPGLGKGESRRRVEACRLRVRPDPTGPLYELRKIPKQPNLWALDERLSMPVRDARPSAPTLSPDRGRYLRASERIEPAVE